MLEHINLNHTLTSLTVLLTLLLHIFNRICSISLSLSQAVASILTSIQIIPYESSFLDGLQSNTTMNLKGAVYINLIIKSALNHT
jgi:hypothetical protein